MIRARGLALLALASCTAQRELWQDAHLGSVSLSVTGSAHDVAHVAFAIAEPAGDCAAGPFVAQETVAIHSQPLDGHRFAAASFVVSPGSYLACAAPLQGDLSPSDACAPASGMVAVVEGLTSTASLVSQCSASSGAIDVEVALNEPPRIDDVQVSPSKFIEDRRSGG
jgi:hypothetical protein